MLWSEAMLNRAVSDLAIYVALTGFLTLLFLGFMRRSSRPFRILSQGIALISVLSAAMILTNWLDHYSYWDGQFAGWTFIKFALLGWAAMVGFLVVRAVQTKPLARGGSDC